MAGAIVSAVSSPVAIAQYKRNGLRFNLGGYDIDKQKAARFGGKFLAFDSAEGLLGGSQVAVLSVKPQMFSEAVAGLELADKLIISIMAGVSVDTISKVTGAARVVRVMPNLNALVGQSFTAYCTSDNVTEDDLFLAQNILGAIGFEPVLLSESLMDAETGVAGSGPAFVFMFLKALEDEAVKLGFDRALAKRMVCDVVYGSTANYSENSADPDALIDSVCSKGGTTIEGVTHLKNANFYETVGTAVKKAADRAKELSRGV